jgi:hypothetical protein
MKKKELNYANMEELLTDREVVVGLKGGTNLGGKVRYIDEDGIVLVNEPTSTLDIELKVSHTIINKDRIDFIQFKTDRT